MKNLLTLLALVLLSISSCQAQGSPMSATEVVHAYNKAVNEHSLDDMKVLFADDALVFGSTPSEKWTKDFFLGLVEKTFSRPNLKLKNDVISTEEIDMGHDQYIVMQTVIFSQISSIVPTRSVYHISKTNDGYKINLISYSLSPEGKDLMAINKYLKEAKK